MFDDIFPPFGWDDDMPRRPEASDYYVKGQTMKIEATAYSGLGPGPHDVTVTAVEVKTSQKFGGTYLRWEFTADDGNTTTANTSSDFTPGNKTGKWYSALTGRTVIVGETYDTDDVIGKPANIYLELTPEGYTKVVSVNPRQVSAKRRANVTPAENAAVQHAMQEGDDLPF